MNDRPANTLATARSLEELYPELAQRCMTAGWHKARPSLWPEPRSAFKPRHWRYADARLAMDRAGEWIGTELAERRNLLTFNPVGDNDYATARTLVSAYQMIKPGEHARTHRHMPNALRVVLDAADGVYTVVNGVRLAMRPGDVLLTPNWCWHSHYNEGNQNAYWIDMLDVPLVHLLEPMFFEPHPDEYQQTIATPDESEFLFTQRAAEAALANLAPDRGGSCKLVLPSQAHIPTMELSFISIRAAGTLALARSTCSRIMAVSAGHGEALIGDQCFEWSRGDLFVIPAWTNCQIDAKEASLLFQASDAPVLKALGFYREEART